MAFALFLVTTHYLQQNFASEQKTLVAFMVVVRILHYWELPFRAVAKVCVDEIPIPSKMFLNACGARENMSVGFALRLRGCK